MLVGIQLTSESLDKNVGRTKLVRACVFLDQGGVAAGNGGLSAERGRPGDGGLCVGHCEEQRWTTCVVVVKRRDERCKRNDKR